MISLQQTKQQQLQAALLQNSQLIQHSRQHASNQRSSWSASKQHDKKLKQLSDISERIDSSSYYKVHFKAAQCPVSRKQAEEYKKRLLEKRF